MYSQLYLCMKNQSLNSAKYLFSNSCKAGLLCHCYSTERTITLYEVLELERNSSPKEIRNAFIRLSKKFHPDKNPNDPKLHDKFVMLNEAYSVLHDIDTRRCYDSSLNLQSVKEKFYTYKKPFGGYDDVSSRPKDWNDFFDFHAQMKKNESIHVPEFIQRLTNLSRTAMALCLVAVAITMFVLQIAAVNYTNNATRTRINQKEMELAQILSDMRMEAGKRDFQGNIDRFLQRVKENKYSSQYSRPES